MLAYQVFFLWFAPYFRFFKKQNHATFVVIPSISTSHQLLSGVHHAIFFKEANALQVYILYMYALDLYSKATHRKKEVAKVCFIVYCNVL